MENKGDVRAMLARFQTGGASTDDSSSAPPVRPKIPLHPTLSSGPTIPSKKPVMESLSGGAITIPPKPSLLKSTVSTKSDTEVHEPNKTKGLTSRFANSQDDNNKPFFNKVPPPLKQPPLLAPEAKGPKPPLHKTPLGSSLSDSKPAFLKPPTAVSPKPSWVKEDSGSSAPSVTSSMPPKIPTLQQKPSSSIAKLWQQQDEAAGTKTDTENKPSPPTTLSAKPSNFRTAQNLFAKADQPDSGVKADAGNIPPPKPPASKKPSLRRPPHSNLRTGVVNSDGTTGPKRKPLQNSLALGPAPAKPNRPPKVNLENFKRGAEVSNGPGTFKKGIIPTSSVSATPAQPPPPPVPSLPPRHLGTLPQPDECYDDVQELISSPPPLPPSTGHPSQRGKEEIDDDDDGEMYEDLEERWEEQKLDKKKEEKEEKKRLEAEKKEQKEREKKEQDARKRFKLVGPLEAIQQGKACVDCRGSKTDLALKQGERLDIIRVQGTPEGKWLGRTQDGTIGYVKTTSVEIDFNSLKNRGAQPEYEPEVYDDIDVVSSESGMKGPAVVLPPPPGEDGEIYDDVVDPNLEVRVPPPSQFTADGSSDHPAPIDEEIYDDVDSQNLPPPPPVSSLPTMKNRSRVEEMDPKKQKKFEKEEKEFRKKFKYDGEIQVLYQVNIIPNLTNKRWGGKELSIKAGEKLDVIVKAVDNKLICRNEDGKFGYVSTGYIVSDDCDIYDDIGDDCIYDND